MILPSSTAAEFPFPFSNPPPPNQSFPTGSTTFSSGPSMLSRFRTELFVDEDDSGGSNAGSGRFEAGCGETIRCGVSGTKNPACGTAVPFGPSESRSGTPRGACRIESAKFHGRYEERTRYSEAGVTAPEPDSSSPSSANCPPAFLAISFKFNFFESANYTRQFQLPRRLEESARFWNHCRQEGQREYEAKER